MSPQSYGPPTPKHEAGPNCDGCPFRGRSQGFSDGHGPDDAKVWFVGEALARQEVAEGLNFRGGAGNIQRRLLWKADIGLSQKDAYITNVVKCRPLTYVGDKPFIQKNGDFKNATPSRAQQQECYNRYLKEELDDFAGRLIVACGDIPLSMLTHEKGIKKQRGALLKSVPHGYRVLPTYHPAALGYNAGLFNVTLRDYTRIAQYVTAEDITPPEIEYTFNASPNDIVDLLQYKSLSVDIETNERLDPDIGDITEISFSSHPYKSTIVNYTSFARDYICRLMRGLDEVTGHNFYAFDAFWFIKKGIPIPKKLWDTLTAHHVANADAPHDLYSVQSEFADIPELNWKKRVGGRYALSKDIVCGRDTDTTLRGRIGLTKFLRRTGQLGLYEDIVMPLQSLDLKLRLQGAKIDTLLMAKYHLGAKKRIRTQESLLTNVVGPLFNWRSPKQLAELLYDRLGLPVKYHHKTHKRTTEAKALEALFEENPQSKIFRLIMQLRKLGKLDSTYFQQRVDSDNFVHPQLMPQGTGTGRQACKDPTIHNIPEGFARQIFIPSFPKWKFVYADYSQIEFIVQAWYGQEWEMIKKAAAGYDFHTMVAALFFSKRHEDVTPEERYRAKFINFGLLYGRGAKSIALAEQLSISLVKGYIEQFTSSMPGIARHRAICVEKAREDGYNETVFHRRRYFSPNEVTKIYNFKPQGTAADITNESFVMLDDALPSPARLTPLTVHDSITAECPEDQVDEVVKVMKEVMQRPITCMPAYRAGMPDDMRFRVKIAVGDNWAAYHEKTNPGGLRSIA